MQRLKTARGYRSGVLLLLDVEQCEVFGLKHYHFGFLQEGRKLGWH